MRHDEIVRRYYDEVLNANDLAAAEAIFDDGWVNHLPQLDGSAPRPVQPGVRGAQQAAARFRAAFPDLHYTLDQLVAEGDRVVACYTMRGTHQGRIMGTDATGRAVVMTGCDVFRLAGDRIVERWTYGDRLSLLQQIGAVALRRD